MLCEACNYYLFSTDDAFRSVGWQQPDLFQMVVKKTFGDGYSREKVSALLLYSVSGGLSRESLHIRAGKCTFGRIKDQRCKVYGDRGSEKAD